MFRRLVLGLSAVLAMGMLSSADARRWHRYNQHHNNQLIVVAESDVDLSLDRYTIDVRQAKGAYKGIRIKNSMGKLFDIRRVEIVYSDGTVWSEDRQIDMYWASVAVRSIRRTRAASSIRSRSRRNRDTDAAACRSSAFRTATAAAWTARAATTGDIRTIAIAPSIWCPAVGIAAMISAPARRYLLPLRRLLAKRQPAATCCSARNTSAS